MVQPAYGLGPDTSVGAGAAAASPAVAIPATTTTTAVRSRSSFRRCIRFAPFEFSPLPFSGRAGTPAGLAPTDGRTGLSRDASRRPFPTTSESKRAESTSRVILSRVGTKLSRSRAYAGCVRSVELAVYADDLCAEAAAFAARAERARSRLRAAALEREARRALRGETVLAL